MLEKMYILLKFAIFCNNLICKSAILKTYGRGFKAPVKKNKKPLRKRVETNSVVYAHTGA